ncbi:MAG: hypothetical protein KBG83_00600 [Bacteroidetes bacterium]|jgi:hypothetical protein|nr:hypothetical protein [Bacteroidota bacterium]
MGWTEFERKLMEINGNWFLNHEDPHHWEILSKIMKEELPEYKPEELNKALEQIKVALLPPISKVRIVHWLQSNLPPKPDAPEPPPQSKPKDIL